MTEVSADMTTAILGALRRSDVNLTAQEIHSIVEAATGATQQEVQTRLHSLDDAGRVFLKCGFYRLSESERAKT